MPERELRSLLAATRARLGAQALLRGATAGLAAALPVVAAPLVSSRMADALSSLAVRVALPVLAAGIGAAVAWWRSSSQRRQPAAVLERLVPASRNLLLTASELDEPAAVPSVARTTPQVTALVRQRADRLAAGVDMRALLPHAPLIARAVAALVLLLATDRIAQRFSAASPAAPLPNLLARAAGRVAIERVTLTVTAPRYASQPVRTLANPDRADALVGSTMTLTVSASADTLLLHMRDTTRIMTRSGRGRFVLSLPVTRDDYLAFEPRGSDGRSGERRLIGLTARADEAPRVRVVAPARDQLLPDANRTLDVRVEADDDLAVGSLRLRYTKVSGSGERFTFSEGEVPVAIARANPAKWSARASLALKPLLTEPGDLVVYRAVVTDTRPGAPAVESDAYIAELATPGGMAALGFSMDPDEDRYAVSQQMVILKTEKLIARRATMTPGAVAEEAAQIAGEQRRVRAEFVFMMGGEFAQQATGEAGMEELDETQEAESESDLAAGRMVNRGRVALLSAIRAMSRAAVALTTAELTPALAQERVALTQLQEAFARSRFLMRALTQREQLDFTRRLTGRLDSTAQSRAPIAPGETDATALAWRAVLAELLTQTRADTLSSPALALLAERVLQIDASSRVSQRLAGQLSAAGAAAARPAQQARARALTDSAAVTLTTLAGRALRDAPAAGTPAALRRLEAALGGRP